MSSTGPEPIWNEASPPRGVPAGTRTVRVDLGRAGGWEVALPDQRELVRCRTLDEAQRVAYHCASHEHPCEVVVFDAYHRVLRRELV